VSAVLASWAEFARAEPDLAGHVRRCFAIRKHATLATLRRDRSPRISGTEVQFDDDGELYLGMMAGSRKAVDLGRDPRLALHCPTDDPPDGSPSLWLGDAKLAGEAIDVSPPGDLSSGHRFRVSLSEVVLTTVGDPPDHLVIMSWHPGRGLRRIERR
jgi:Pyridoxamine 5'-phosphate oxidase